MIAIEQATKAFGKKTLFHDLNLMFEEQKVTVLLGENGAGKSTLLHILAGLENLNTGRILYQNSPITSKQIHEIIGFVPQEIALWDHLTVQQNIQFFKKQKKGAISDEQIKRYCEQLHLVDLHQPISKLSGGTKRKANLLIGLLHQPKFLILDEPTVGIDLKSRYEIQALIRQLKSTCTIVMTTHHLDEVEAVADHIITIGKDPFYKQVLQEKGLSFIEANEV